MIEHTRIYSEIPLTENEIFTSQWIPHRNFQLKKAVCLTHQKLLERVETLLETIIVSIYTVKLLQSVKLPENESIFWTPPWGQDILSSFSERQMCCMSDLMSSTESWANPEYSLRVVRMAEKRKIEFALTLTPAGLAASPQVRVNFFLPTLYLLSCSSVVNCRLDLLGPSYMGHSWF